MIKKGLITYLFLIVIIGCDGPVSFERTVPFDPLNENYTPHSPSNVNISRETNTTLKIEWRDMSTKEDGFVLERQYEADSFLKIASLDSNTTAYIDTISNFGTYKYRVQAKKGTNFSNYSPAASILISRWKKLDGGGVANSQGIFIDENRILFIPPHHYSRLPKLFNQQTYSWDPVWNLETYLDQEFMLTRSEQGGIFQIIGEEYNLNIRRIPSSLNGYQPVTQISYNEFGYKEGTLKTLNIHDNQLLIYLIDRGADNNKNQPLVILFNFETYEHKQISVPEDLININTLLQVGESSVFFGSDSVSFFYNYQTNEWDIKPGPGESTEGFKKSFELPGNRIFYVSQYQDFIYDINTESWRKIKRISNKKLFHAIKINDNKILAIEPYRIGSFYEPASVLLFDPELEAWKHLETNRHVTFPGSAVLLKNKNVLFTGGMYLNSYPNDAAIFRTGAFKDYY